MKFGNASESLTEASAKIRTGGPKDKDEDLSFPVWAGVLPLSLVPGKPVEHEASAVHEIPEYLAEYSRKRVAK